MFINYHRLHTLQSNIIRKLSIFYFCVPKKNTSRPKSVIGLQSSYIRLPPFYKKFADHPNFLVNPYYAGCSDKINNKIQFFFSKVHQKNNFYMLHITLLAWSVRFVVVMLK